jgi:hypothetical protein
MGPPKKPSIADKLLKYRYDPKAFFYEVLFKDIEGKPVKGSTGDILKLTSQQEKACDEIRKIVVSKIRLSKGVKISPEEMEYAKKFGVSIRSGKGTGKDFFAAGIIVWFQYCYREAKVAATAPSAHQLQDVLWSELSKLYTKSCLFNYKEAKANPFELQKTRFFLKENPNEHFATCITSNTQDSPDKQSKTLDGLHSPYMLFVIDEADGVPDPVFTSFDTTLTGALNFVLMIFNPTRSQGYAIESHMKAENRKYWVCLHWNAEESENVTKEQIERMARHGTDTNFYRVYVKGEPPNADPDTLIPWDWAVSAQDRAIEPLDDDPVLVGIDVARFGNDKSVILSRKGWKVTGIKEFEKIDTEALSGWAEGVIHDLVADKVMVDTIGVGGGVADKLRARIHNGVTDIVDINVSESPANRDKFHKLRDELWWKVREMFEKKAVSIPKNDILLGELTSIKYSMPNGKIKIEGKAELKRRGKKSPNIADALCLSSYFDDEIARAMTKAKKRGRQGITETTWRTA